MTRWFILIACVLLGLLLAAPVQAQDPPSGQEVRILLPEGKTWRGHIGDRVKVVYSERGLRQIASGTIDRFDRAGGWLFLSGPNAPRTPIFAADITEVIGSGPASTPDQSEPKAAPAGDAASEDTAAKDGEDSEEDLSIRGTFYLPMSGMVGEKFRAEEIQAVAAQADELGPGQTIVLHITSGGGYVVEWWMIRDAIYEAQKRLRMVAWVRDSTSAAASTSLACDVIVFESQGHLGSITTIGGGGKALPAAEQVKSADDDLAKVLARSGYSPLMAVPFKTGQHPRSLLSYSVDPDTGDVTWFNGLEGDTILNEYGEVLTINAREAVECKLAIGIADSKEELGKLLHQGGWREIGSGQELRDTWHSDFDACRDYLAKSRMEVASLPDNPQGIRKKIKIYKKWLQWWDRAANACRGQAPPRAQIEQMIEMAEEQLKDLLRRG